jgi:hypothetical protein
MPDLTVCVGVFLSPHGDQVLLVGAVGTTACEGQLVLESMTLLVGVLEQLQLCGPATVRAGHRGGFRLHVDAPSGTARALPPWRYLVSRNFLTTEGE